MTTPAGGWGEESRSQLFGSCFPCSPGNHRARPVGRAGGNYSQFIHYLHRTYILLGMICNLDTIYNDEAYRLYASSMPFYWSVCLFIFMVLQTLGLANTRQALYHWVTSSAQDAFSFSLVLEVEPRSSHMLRQMLYHLSHVPQPPVCHFI
jgi:hypothetical protein